MKAADGKNETDLGKLANVFGDPTRRGIYRHLRNTAGPLSASEVAEEFGLHRTVARAHLEKLVELDLVKCGTRRRPAGGRPAKTYALTSDRLEIMLPPRCYERLARLLLRMVDERLSPGIAEVAAFDFGRDYGEEVARRHTGDGEWRPLDPHAMLGWLDDAGYDVTLDDADPAVVAVEVRNCVYRELAQEYPRIVCLADCGMRCGMLGAERSQHCQTRALALGDDYCRHEFRL